MRTPPKNPPRGGEAVVPAGAVRCEALVFAVYAPLGTDEILSVYPASSQQPVHRQALVKALQGVAEQGVNVSALVDLFEDDTYLVEIPAGQPAQMSIVSAWKQDMSTPQALAGFLRRTAQRFPGSALVLAIEGHGGGFVPDIDPARITRASATRWTAGGQTGTVRWTQTGQGTGFEPEPGSPALPMTSPELPMTSPELPAARLPMSTWALGAALRSAIRAGVPRPAVIHFNNCFNASFEQLHTVAPHAGFATAYANYNFYTAGQSYPGVFQKLRAAGTASARQLAEWFAAANGAALAAKGNHPTVGATVELAAMRKARAALDKLALALTTALQTAGATQRPALLAQVKQAAAAAQQYDTSPGYALEAPDQMMDIGSFAAQLHALFPPGPVKAAAAALGQALAGIWQYGHFDRPWLDESQVWDFRSPTLGLNIFFPDPALEGLWDWRSPYYLAGRVDPQAPPAHRHVIGFLADSGSTRPPWVRFIVEYHRDVKFVGLLPALAPVFPIFNARFKRELPPPGNDSGKDTGAGTVLR